MKKVLLPTVAVLFATGCQTSAPTVAMHKKVLSPAKMQQLQGVKNISVSSVSGDHKHLSNAEFTEQLNQHLQRISVDGQSHFNLVSEQESDVLLTSAFEVSSRTKHQKRDKSVCLATKTDKDDPMYATKRKDCTSWAKSPAVCQTILTTVKFMPELVASNSNDLLFEKTYKATRVTSSCGGDIKFKPKSKETLTAEALKQVLYEFSADIAPHYQIARLPLINKDKADNTDVILKDAMLTAQSGQMQQACQKLAKGADENQQSPALLYNTGVCYEAQGDMAYAKQFYQQAMTYSADLASEDLELLVSAINRN